MGKHEQKIAASHKNMSPAQIRATKNERCKVRNNRRRTERRAEAETRQEGWASMTPQQQLKALDGRLGKGVGAKKQRAKIREKINESK